MRRLGRQGATVDGATLSELHDTLGMLVEFCVEEANRTGIALPTRQTEYDALMDAQRERSHRKREAASVRASVDPRSMMILSCRRTSANVP
jgi:alanyl-tRNA synthetase